MARSRKQRYMASFERHNGNQDEHGTPTYGVADDWDTVLQGWPCEKLETGGGEVVRGRQITAETRFLLIGDFLSVEAAGIDTTCRTRIRDDLLSIIAITDADGDRRKARIQCRREV